MGKIRIFAAVAQHIIAGIDDSLRSLAWIRGYFIRPTASITRAPIEETVEALHDVVKAGKALYIGASSMYAWQCRQDALYAGATWNIGFVTMQNTTTSYTARRSGK